MSEFAQIDYDMGNPYKNKNIKYVYDKNGKGVRFTIKTTGISIWCPDRNAKIEVYPNDFEEKNKDKTKNKNEATTEDKLAESPDVIIKGSNLIIKCTSRDDNIYVEGNNNKAIMSSIIKPGRHENDIAVLKGSNNSLTLSSGVVVTAKQQNKEIRAVKTRCYDDKAGVVRTYDDLEAQNCIITGTSGRDAVSLYALKNNTIDLTGKPDKSGKPNENQKDYLAYYSIDKKSTVKLAKGPKSPLEKFFANIFK